MHLTYRNEPSEPSATDAAGLGAPGMEITPEMIEAGETVLLVALGGAVETFWQPSDLARRVYQAMTDCRHRLTK